MLARKGKSLAKLTMWVLLSLCMMGYRKAKAHTLPDSKAQLTVKGSTVLLRFKTPFEILELALKKQINLQSSDCLDNLRLYFIKHLAVKDSLHSDWDVTVSKIFSQDATDKAIGKYKEIVAEIWLTPSNANSLKNFFLHCDLIIHQIPNQSIFFFVEQDEALQANTNSNQIGVISIDIPTGKIFPLQIHLQEISWWDGFEKMFALGMRHIREGTDHLLFILTLLLPACLLAENKKWTSYQGLKASILKLLKIVTAFTVGHSITLLIGVFGLVKFSSQWIEVIIAMSILISVIHAIRPLFYNKEIFIALGFGLVHGLAFSQTLMEFDLDYVSLMVNVLAFNLGIEAMQIFIILLIIPWFVMMSQTTTFSYVKNFFASLAGIASLGWILQRISGVDNFITQATDRWLLFSPWLILCLGIFATILFLISKANKHLLFE